MRLSLLTSALVAFTGLAVARDYDNEYDRPDLRGSYWDVSISTQSGRPGYTITDFNVTFHSPYVSEVFAPSQGKCHYSFVPQGTSAPAETNECEGGLKYEWNCRSYFEL